MWFRYVNNAINRRLGRVGKVIRTQRTSSPRASRKRKSSTKRRASPKREVDQSVQVNGYLLWYKPRTPVARMSCTQVLDQLVMLNENWEAVSQRGGAEPREDLEQQSTSALRRSLSQMLCVEMRENALDYY